MVFQKNGNQGSSSGSVLEKEKFRLQFQFWKPDPVLVPGNLV
jgi:hypothetical protein